MKFSVLQQDLLPVLSSVGRSVGVRSTLPVLDNILLSAKDKKLKVAATNLEIAVIEYINVEVVAEGELTVPGKTLTEIVSGLGQVKIEIESDGEILTVGSGKFKASINGIPASEFPAIPLSEEVGITFPKEAFLYLSRILFASAVDEGRPALTGILTDVSGGKLDFVATDGFRLAHQTIEVAKDTPKFKNLIPKKTFEEILRLISEFEVDSVSISSSSDQNQAIFNLGQVVISSRLIEGNFPSWEKIIPQQFVSRVIADKEVLFKAIKLAAVFSRGEANIVVINAKKSALFIKSSAKEVGSQENEIEAQVEGEELEVAFNTKFLLDVVSACPSAQVAIEFSGPLSAAQIKPVGVEGLEYIIMPVRLS